MIQVGNPELKEIPTRTSKHAGKTQDQMLVLVRSSFQRVWVAAALARTQN
jgi:hypothetical protein